MNKQQHNSVWLLGLIVFTVFCNAGAATGVEGQTKPDTSAKVRLEESYGKLPLSFEANHGQTDKKVQFVSRGQGYGLFLTPTEAVLSLHKSNSAGTKTGTSSGRALQVSAGKILGNSVQSGQDKVAMLRMNLVGGNTNPHIQGLDELPGKVNYFRGKDPKQWRTHIPTYAKAKYEKIYPGIDLVYYGNGRQLEYDFIVAPGADPKAVRLAFEGIDTLSMNKQGDLVLKSAGGDVSLRKPRVYQDINGQQHEIEGRYMLCTAKSHCKGQVGFQVAAYDRARPLVIDPVLVYSTYLGGGDAEEGYGIAVDSVGNAYVTGFTTSANFPTVNAKYPHFLGNRDAFVTKLSANGQTVVYSTYLSGSGFETGYGIAVDSAGNATVTGDTDSTDFPTANAKYPQLWGGSDAFVTKLSANGQTVVYSTYLGGSNWDEGHGIAVDNAGNGIVTGWTSSANFPAINAKYPQNRGFFDAFVTKLSANGQTVVYSTYLGGSDYDEGRGIAVDSAGNATVTGYTNSANFPAVNAKYPQLWGDRDAFVTKLSANGQTVVYSTYLGGSNWEIGQGIAVDSAGNAHVTGVTTSANFPTVNARYSQHWGDSDAFVTKLSANGQTVVYSTYLGGSVSDFGDGIAVDSAGNATVTGETNSTNFPTVNAKYPQYRGYYDAFITKLSANGQTVVYSTYLGGSVTDEGHGIAVDSAGNATVTGDTDSTDFPTSATDSKIVSYDPTHNGGYDAFIAKFSAGFTLRQPLANLSIYRMQGKAIGQCLYGGYCARSLATQAHNGIDYAVAAGTHVYAVCNGTVKVARNATTTPNIWNRFTIIDHSKCGGFSALFAYYGHIDATVTVGQKVTAGQSIGTVGNWGSNSHLHLSLNSAYKTSGWGYVELGESTVADCNKASVTRRRTLLASQGWLDPAMYGSASSWNPFLLQGGATAGNCNAPAQNYILAPMGKSLPYFPWKTP